MTKLKIAVENTDEEIQNYKLDSLPLWLTCKRCKHHWGSTIGQVDDSPECPKCKK